MVWYTNLFVGAFVASWPPYQPASAHSMQSEPRAYISTTYGILEADHACGAFGCSGTPVLLDTAHLMRLSTRLQTGGRPR